LQGNQEDVEMETTFVFYCSGLPASAKVNLEIFLNFEVIPTPGGTLVETSSMQQDLITNPYTCKSLLTSKVANYSRNVEAYIAGDTSLTGNSGGSNFGLGTGSGQMHNSRRQL
jgi:hypothetical protein